MIACVVALALLVGGVVTFVLLSDGDDDGGSDSAEVPSSALDVAWQSGELPATTASSGSSVRWPGRWSLDGVFVYGDDHGIRGFDASTGQQKWQVKPPKGAGEPCAMSPEASNNGVGAVLFDSGGDECTYLAAIDVDTGTVTWSKKLPVKYGSSNTRVVAGRENITVALNTVEPIRMFDVQSGAPVDPFATAELTCAYTYVFSAHKVVAKPECKDEIVVVDTQYEGPAVTIPHQKGEPLRILRDHPLSVAVSQDDSENSRPRLLNIGDDDEVETVDLTGPAADIEFENAVNAGTSNGYYYAKLRSGSHAVFDLATGKAVWKSGKAQTSFIGHDDSRDRLLIATSHPEHSYWTRVAALDPASGDVTPAGEMVMSDGSYLSQSSSVYAYEGGNVVTVGDRAADGKRLAAGFDVDLSSD